MRLEGKTAIVTGGAKGIGAAIVRRFVDEGANVAFVDSDAQAGRSLQAGERTLFIEGDLTKRDFPAEAVATAVARFGQLDILVNNAGITHIAPFLEVEEEDFDRVLAVNLRSYFTMGQAAARKISSHGGGGAIINMSSINAVLAMDNQVPYVVSKGAVNQLTRVMALALAPHGIRVNAIGPGTIATELAKRVVMTSDEARRRLLSRTPMKRFGEPEEVAAVAVFLASSDSSYMTGQVIYPDGGRLALNYTVEVD